MFSIVIPMFNASETILKTLESCTNQSFLPKEIILIDDRSSDDSYAVVQKWKANYSGELEIIIESLEKNSGPSKARNRGWELASGEYIAFLDADDFFTDNKLDKIKDILNTNKEIVLLGHSYGMDTKVQDESNSLKHLHTIDFLMKNHFTTSAVIVQKKIKERFDETMRYTEDQDLFLRVTQKYNRTYALGQTLVLRTRAMNEVGGLSGNLWEMRKGEIEMYRKYCKRNKSMLLFPLFASFSLSKHFIKMIK